MLTKYIPVISLVLLYGVPASVVMADHFDTSLLAGRTGELDLSWLADDRQIPAGQQDADVYVNGEWKGRYTLLLGAAKSEMSISALDAGKLGIKLEHSGHAMMDLSEVVREGSYDLDVGTMSLRLEVPQAYLNRSESGYVDPEHWDEGVPAIFFGYNATQYSQKSKQGGTSSDDLYLGLESGINFNGWQLRDRSSLRKTSSRSSTIDNSTRYLQRNIASVKSTFRLGDFYTAGELFDSVRVRGAALSSDMSMLPSSQQGFAPIVRGVAKTNALVKVVQNGNVLHQENVAPGPFVLDGIQPSGSAGDLTVIVREADGSKESFRVPYSAVPNMLKEGVSNYQLIAGRVNQHNTEYDPEFIQGTFQYGLNNLVTAYAGSTLSSDYKAHLVGSGWNLPIGAVSVDITHADTQLLGARESGQSARITYSKFVGATSTNFTLGAYRYSTQGYYSFNDAVYSNTSYRELAKRLAQRERIDGRLDDLLDLNTWDAIRGARPRNTFNLSLNQRLGEKWGALYFSGTQRDYWSATGKSREYQLGYSNTFGRMSYNLAASRVRNAKREEQTTFYLSLSVPFDIAGNTAFVSSSASATGSQYQQSNLSLSANALESNRLTYSLTGSNQQGGQNMFSASSDYRSSVSTVGASYSESRDHRQTGLSARGSIVAIAGHVLAANEAGSTMTVVEAPKARGLTVNGDKSILTNRDGMALVPYATPYRVNSITLSGTGSDSGAELLGNVATTVPFAGAISHVRFETDPRQSYFISAKREDGSPLPFGAEVKDQAGQAIGFVGQSSVLYVKANEVPEFMAVSLGTGSCVIDVQQRDIAFRLCR